ncbi:MAG: hypothetical protein HRU20_28210 [Pseudomonadales bacterium]|nr:hypothetical protein [Pseudomonadales bacterium]
MDTSTEAKPRAVMPNETVIGLYKNCMEFTLNSRTFLLRTTELHRVGINAQVMAAQSGEAAPVLSALVSEIGVLTAKISAALNLISGSGGLLAKNAIKTTKTANQLQMYYQAWEIGLEVKTNTLLLSIYEKKEAEMYSLLREVRDQLSAHTATLAELQKTVIFIPALINLINVNVAEYPQYSEQFRVTSTELNDFKDFIESSTSLMSNRIKEAIHLINSAI